MSVQNHSNHRRYVPGFHFLASALCLVALVASIINLVHHWYDPELHLISAIVLLITIILIIFFWYIRSFALRAQDRAIRAEEALRHYLMTGKPIDSRLRLGQIIALRFASDAELIQLTKRAVEENLRAEEIKKAIKEWREDLHRV